MSYICFAFRTKNPESEAHLLQFILQSFVLRARKISTPASDLFFKNQNTVSRKWSKGEKLIMVHKMYF